MNALERLTLVNSLTDKCFEEVEVIDNDMGTYIVKYEGKYCVVRFNVCKEYPAEIIRRFNLDREIRQERENHKMMKLGKKLLDKSSNL